MIENISSSKQEARMLKNVAEIWKAGYSTSNRIKSFQFKSRNIVNIVSQPIMAKYHKSFKRTREKKFT